MSAPSMVQWQGRVFAVTWFAYAGFYLCRKNFSVLMPLLGREPGFGKDWLAHAIFAYSLMYAVGQFVMGSLADRFGSRRVVTAGMVVSGAASAAMALWPHPVSILGLQAINGLAQACGWPGLVRVMAWWFPRSNRGVVMAWWTNNYALGGFLATIFATYAATGPLWAALGWRRAAIAPGIVLGLLGLVYWILVPDRPRDAGLDEMEDGAELPRATGAPLLEVARHPAIRRLAGAYFFIKLTRYSFLFWLPMYLSERLKFSDAQAGYWSAVYEVAGLVGVLAAGYLSDRVFQGRRNPVAVLLLLSLAVASGLPPMLARTGPWAALASIALIGALTFGADTLIGGVATQDASSHHTAASAAGFVNGVGSTGQLLSPYLVASTVQRFGWDLLFVFFMALAAAAGFLMAGGWRTEPAAEKATA